ncbi:MAG: hypothetical protein PHQ66_02860 [Candidatus Nanoarchaeia archaeon]|nr:hypothetical protein [Candidatus Nanoarchaeia archaeon]MDD5357694.1 hypothetical protein [Candidatus Nanoarchaeia archaeon]MDD5588613.1 hypothetical protein [Candidatus Nanoarchaeia archaeon]
MNKRGISTIVITVILISLSMAAVVIVWASVNAVIKNQIGSSESCFGNYDKVQINKQYTCYNSSSDEIRFSLMVGDIEIDKIVVSVSSESAVKSYEITNTPENISTLTMYPSGDSNIVLPEKNSGLTYRATGFDSEADLIKIAPVIGGNQCEVADTLSQIEDCSLLV